MTEEDIATDPSPRSLRRDLWRNLRSGLRVAFLLGANNAGFVATWTQFALLVALSVLSTLFWQLVDVGWPGQFHPGALPVALFFLPVLFMGAWAAAAIAGRSASTLVLVVAILSAGLWIDAAMGLVGVFVDRSPRGLRYSLQWGAYYAYNGWYALCAAVAAVRMFPAPGARRVAMALIVGLLAGQQLYSQVEGRLWTKAVDERAAASAPAYDVATSEEVLYLQPRLLERDFAALLPRREGRPNLYLVSVAGYAEQDVFLREVQSVDALFAERFGTRGRSLRLVNNRGTLRETPLATHTSIAESLRRVGKLMNPDEDVLFLFLTSHGSPDGRFTLSFWPFRLQDLSAAELRRMLDDAGIRNRVIVVSSCYSGAFVEALRNDDTLVMTASARDRNSFGCSNEADFTYFGKAFFDEALRSSDSFVDAFERALPAIAARERQESFPASRPQKAMGANIGPRLDALHAAIARDRAAQAK